MAYLGGKSVFLQDRGHLLGLFCYTHEDDWIAGPYLCKKQPIKPLKLAELPKHIQSLISGTQFKEVRFQDAERLQPIEYTQCKTWVGSERWMDTKGKIHGSFVDM